MKITLHVLVSLLLCISTQTYAQGTNAMAERIQLMNKEKDPYKNVAAMDKIIQDYHLDAVKNAEEIDVLKGQVALSFLNANELLNFEKYVGLIKNKFNETSYMNMAADMLLRNHANLDYAVKLAEKTVILYASFKDDPMARPAEFPIDDWNRFMQMAGYPYYESYAAALYAKGDYKRALQYEEQAIHGKETGELMPSSVELYALILEKVGKVDQACNLLMKMAAVGKTSIKMDTQLKNLLITQFGNKRATMVLDSLQRNIENAYRIEIAAKMIDGVEAPNFTLFDLYGKKVELINLRGKIVVLDFWATWCAPCIASMPAMKKIEALHPDVVFLFIATQETGIDAEQRIKAYVARNNFPLRVLLDAPSLNLPKVFPVLTAYKVEAIPAKMVIDKKGNLRFFTNGYSSDAELINELTAMIAIAKEQ